MPIMIRERNPNGTLGDFRPVFANVVTKERKIEELDRACEAAILTGFRSETTCHFYRFNRDDQINFTQQMILMMANPDHTEVLWKTEDAGPVLHSKEQFLSVVAEAEAHKRGCMQRFWELKSIVLAAETDEEWIGVSWEGSDGTTAV